MTVTSRPSYATRRDAFIGQACQRRDVIGCSETRTVGGRRVLETRIPVRLFTSKFAMRTRLKLEQLLWHPSPPAKTRLSVSDLDHVTNIITDHVTRGALISAARWRRDRHFRYMCGRRRRLCKTTTFDLGREPLMDFLYRRRISLSRRPSFTLTAQIYTAN